MSGHTPGPWTIEPTWAHRGDADVAIVNRAHMGSDWDVCSVHSTEANARLIAAAPELLAFAELFVSTYHEEGVPNFEWFAHEAQRIIAAATGEQA